ncbi:MAG: alpha/beta fold hydrolase [Chloroflexi bacterium]|nr:alpha/beta fold hydrolase [Chloroflexota bacterium]
MTQHAHLDPAPFLLDGGPIGVLLIHGFTGAPPEMRLVGDYLHARGLTVAAPLLPGHGTTPADLNRCRWTDWTAAVEAALAALRSRCPTVFVGGLSMGSLLTLYLAGQHPDLPGVIAYSPATWVADRRIALTPLARYFVATLPVSAESDLADPQAELRFWCYDVQPVAAAAELLTLMRQVRRLLPQVTCPLLVVYSPRDAAIHPASGRRTFERAGSPDKRLVRLERSGHGITADIEWETVAEQTYRFIRAHTESTS